MSRNPLSIANSNETNRTIEIMLKCLLDAFTVYIPSLMERAYILLGSLRLYAFRRLSSQDVDDKLKFFEGWVRAHTEDAEKILHMPVLFTEFGLSDKKPGFCEDKRNAFYSIVYDQVHQSALRQGAAAGALQWQLLPAAMSDWNDGYGFDPACGSSICSMVSQQSARLNSNLGCGPASGAMFAQENHGNTSSSPGKHSISNMFKKGLHHIFK